jgi:hypothetical protein
MPIDIADAVKPEFHKLYTKVIQMYEIVTSDTTHRYCANYEAVEDRTDYETRVYHPLAIRRSAITSEEGTSINELEIGLDNVDLEFSTMIASGILIGARCNVYIGFFNPGWVFWYNNSYMRPVIWGKVKIFSGYLDEPKGDEKWVTMTIRPFPMFNRDFPKRIFQVGCNWVFGTGPSSGHCTKDRSGYDITTTVENGSDVEHIHIPNSGRDHDYFVPGFMEVKNGDYVGLIRPIATSTASVITLRVALDFELAEGTSIRLQKLCAKSLTACDNIFNNKVEFGGFVGVPKQPKL